MTTSLPTIVFERLSARVATWTVTQQAAGFGLTHDAMHQQYSLGVRARPCYQLVQPFSPDDGWQITALPSGALIAPGASSEAAASPQYGEWSNGWGTKHDLDLLGQLPTASYLLVRCSRRVSNPDHVLLGNDRVATRPNMRVLHDGAPIYSLVVGPDPQSAPSSDGPLLGLAILNYVGDAWMHGLVFFQHAAPDASPTRDDRLLIIPTDGEFILDNMSGFSADNEARSRALWRDQTAMQFARWCAGETVEGY